MSDRAEFEEFRDYRNAALEREGHKPGSNWHVNNTHYQTWQAARAQSGRGAEPVAFGIFYKGVFQEHAWNDDAAQAIALEDYSGLDGITVQPIYTQPHNGEQGGEWVRCDERVPEPRDSGRKAPNGILVKFDTGRITQIHDVTETLVARMKNGPRQPAKFEAPTPPRIVEWMDLDSPQPPKQEGE